MNFNEAMNIINQRKKKLPVDVVAIAKDLDIKVFKVNDWKDDLSGLIKKDDEHYSIYVNAKHSEERQRFTIAHEIAHYVLHKPMIGNGIADDALYRSGLPNSVEAEANQFAADILMPDEAVKELWKDPKSTLDSMANIFHVSDDAMAIRLGVPN